MGNGPGKPAPHRFGKVLGGLLTAAGLFALLRFTDQNERLTELPRGTSDAFVAVQDGRVYFRQFRRSPAFSVSGLPVYGGKVQRLINDLTLPTAPEAVQLTAAAIFYTFAEPTDPPSTDSPSAAPFGPTGGYERPGVLLSQWERERTGWPRIPRKRVRRASVGGGAPTELIPNEFASAVQIRGDYCFWVRSRRTARDKPLLTRTVERPQGELMVTPVTGGPHRKIAHVADDVALLPCGDGVCWRHDPATSTALLSTGPPDFGIEAFPDFPRRGAPLQLGERLYWLDGDPDSPPSGPPRNHTLMSAKRDGSERQLLWDTDTPSDTLTRIGDLLGDGRDLYFSVDRAAGAKPVRQIVRYRTTADGKPETLHRAATASAPPRPVSVDQGYLYLLSWEERENWFDWSRAGLVRRRVGILSRIRLPD